MRDSFRSVGAGGLRYDTVPGRLYSLAKRRFWDPEQIDFTRDAADWAAMTAEERDVVLRLVSLFEAGEEAVTLDLLPLVQTIAAEGRVEEEIYLTSFLLEEAKHVEFFGRFLQAVGERGDLHRYHSPSYQQIFYHELPGAMNRLRTDSSPRAQVEAAVTYNLIVEGLLAETGYNGFHLMLQQRGLLPGLRAGVERTKNDESRHLAWGIYHISRLVAADRSLLEAVEGRASALLEPALGVINETFAPYIERGVIPFDLQVETFLEFGMNQYQRRMAAVERAAGRSEAEIARLTNAELDLE